MENLKNITATANQNKRTFTIRVYFDGKISSKYRTTKMSKQEFEDSEFNTYSDWESFLSYNSGSYYEV